MRRKHETINGHNISVWDDGDKVVDRYTVVFLDDEYPTGKVPYLAIVRKSILSSRILPAWGNVDSLCCVSGRGGAFKRRIKFSELPGDCQRAVLQDLCQ